MAERTYSAEQIQILEGLEAIRRRPQLFAELIRRLKDMPDHAVLRLVREVRDGEW